MGRYNAKSPSKGSESKTKEPWSKKGRKNESSVEAKKEGECS